MGPQSRDLVQVGRVNLLAKRSPDASGVLALAHVAAGLTDAETAEAMGVSVGRVRYSLRTVIERLGATNRPHAVARAIAEGLLRVDPAKAESEPEGVAAQAPKETTLTIR